MGSGSEGGEVREIKHNLRIVKIINTSSLVERYKNFGCGHGVLK